MANAEKALQGKYGDYRGIFGITSRQKITVGIFLLMIRENG